MSLVDYASSSDDDKPDDREEKEDEKTQNETQGPCSSPTKTVPQISESRSSRQPENAPKPSAPSSVKLPDASLLLNSPTVSLLSGTDHDSRVAVAMAESALRKRDSKELPSALPRTKVPRGTLGQTKTVSDTVGDLLIPPQLTGRSNIVTEDIGKLFVRKNAEPSSH